MSHGRFALQDLVAQDYSHVETGFILSLGWLELSYPQTGVRR
jgi:hypothetical protein